MKPFSVFAIGLIIVLGSLSPASAYFIGDQIHFEFWSQGALIESSDTVTISDGPDESDTALLSNRSALLDMDADRFSLDMMRNNGFSSSSLFTGFKVIGLENQQNPDWILLGVDITTDLIGWSDDRFSTSTDENGLNLAFNFEGMSLPTGRSLTAVFEFGPNPIPIPATAALFITGLVGFAFLRRKLRN